MYDKEREIYMHERESSTRLQPKPCIETNYACRSNLRRRKYASNAFKVNCISLCRGPVSSAAARHYAQYVKISIHTHICTCNITKKERERVGRGLEGGRWPVSLRAHENCMENKLHGQREYSCKRITRAYGFGAICVRRVHTQKRNIRLYAGQIHWVN